jgi:ankyrin repeat protein
LMLAVTSKESNIECIKIILNSGADYKKKDEFGNNLLHLAAKTGNNKILDYIAKNLKIGIFERNKAGETALGICQSLNHEECTKTLESL